MNSTSTKKLIPVTKSLLPKEKYKQYLFQIWETSWVINMRLLASHLEEKLTEFLNVKHLIFVTNGTVALQMVNKALELKVEIITTPFSFVATIS